MKDLEMYLCIFGMCPGLWEVVVVGAGRGWVFVPEYEELYSSRIKLNQALIKSEEAVCYSKHISHAHFKSCLEFRWLDIQKTHQSPGILHFLGIKCKRLGQITEFREMPRSVSQQPLVWAVITQAEGGFWAAGRAQSLVTPESPRSPARPATQQSQGTARSASRLRHSKRPWWSQATKWQTWKSEGKGNSGAKNNFCESKTWTNSE